MTQARFREGLVFTIVTWAALFGAYLLFAGAADVTECATGMVAAVLGAGLAAAWRTIDGRRLALRAPWATLLLRPLAALPPNTLQVGRALVGAIRRRPAGEVGTLQRQPFRHGDDGAAAAGRRGLATLAMSFAPNGYVVDVPDGADAMLVHRIRAESPARDREWPL